VTGSKDSLHEVVHNLVNVVAAHRAGCDSSLLHDFEEMRPVGVDNALGREVGALVPMWRDHIRAWEYVAKFLVHEVD